MSTILIGGNDMYKSKLLFKNTNGTLYKDPSAIESVWAFIYGVDTKKTGRYRIRITKMSAQELIQMGVAPEDTPQEFYGLQATLDQWHGDHGWLALFDWVGDPMAEIDDIERDLGKQFQAFVTGISIDEAFEFDAPKPPKPPKKKDPTTPPKDFKIPTSTVTKYPDLKGIPKDKINKLPKNPKIDPDDFDWI